VKFSDLSIVSCAPIYKSMPLKWLRRLSESKSAVLWTRVPNALAKELAGAECINDLNLELGSDVFAEPSWRKRILICSEETGRERLFQEPDMMLRASLNFESVVFPIRNRDRLSRVFWGSGTSFLEKNDVNHWVWIDSEKGDLELSVRSASEMPFVMLTCDLVSANEVQRHVRVSTGLCDFEFSVNKNQKIMLPLDLTGGSVVVRFRPSGPVYETKSKRRIAIAIQNVTLVALDGKTLLDSAEAYRDLESPDPSTDLCLVRHCLHSFGFLSVGGWVASETGLQEPQSLQTTVSVPAIVPDRETLGASFRRDPLLTDGAIAWVHASTNPQVLLP